MNLYEFIALELDARANEIWKEGIFIQNYKDHTQSCNLYFLHGFYAEVTMDASCTAIIHITPFKRGTLLDKYLEFVNLNL